jgi:hypothetical protein
MIVRKYNPLTDAEQVEEIYNKFHATSFNQPALSRTLDNCVVEKDGKIIAYGGLELLLECVLVLDQEAGKKDQVEAVKMIIAAGEFSARLHRFPGLYSFPKPVKWMKAMIKHFGFTECSPMVHKEVDLG